MLNGLDLFSGIGGIAEGLRPWVKPVAYCEIEPYCQRTLLSRMECGDIHAAPIWDDVRTLRALALPKMVDVIYGGFPCQDISSAGRGIGLGGERSGLFQHIIRLVEEKNPRFVFLENVPAIRTRGLNSVAQAFTEIGYDCRWTIVSAKEVGACHVRKRWFGLAHANGAELRIEPGRIVRPGGETPAISCVNGESRTNPDSDGGRLEGVCRRQSRIPRPVVYHGWTSQPTIRGGNNGIPHRVDRIRALGNAVVPAQAREAFMRLNGINRLRSKVWRRKIMGIIILVFVLGLSMALPVKCYNDGQ